ncbi:hypothetical protein V5E38_14080 [Rossellomorea sp. GAMAL-10_SWC]
MYIQLTKKLSDEMKIKVEKPDLSNEINFFAGMLISLKLVAKNVYW